MKHVESATRYAGIELGDRQIQLLNDYAGWLRSEGYRAGGIGPDELNRVERRHLADSILFATGLGSATEVWDLGSGVGLPGIPLAIVLPEVSFLLIDRSGRRVDLLRRAVRILDLQNCQVIKEEIEALTGRVDALVSRASLPPSRMAAVARRLLRPGGTAVLGGSWVGRPDEEGWETLEIPRFVLDQPVWLLIMRRA